MDGISAEDIAAKNLPTKSYHGPYGEVVTTQRPPHRQFPCQAWGLQTVRLPPPPPLPSSAPLQPLSAFGSQGCWSSFGEYFPASGGVVKDAVDPTSKGKGEYIPPRNKAESGVKKNLTSVVLGSDRIDNKNSTYARDHSNPRMDADGNVTLQWVGKTLDPDTGKNVSC